MNLLEMFAANQLKKTGATKKLYIPGQANNQYEVCAIPLDFLYYNDQNGRINTTYKQYQSKHGLLNPEIGDSKYNEIFQKFIVDSNKQALNDTLQSIDDKTQQEPGVVLPDGRVIDGNRRFTALRMLQSRRGITQTFEAVILPLNNESKADEKTIKELELDLQLGREERVNYDPIDRIFDVYNTIEVEQLMTIEEYKKASGAGNTKGINRDIRLAKLILRFINIVSPGGNAIDKFYLARDLKIDGPIEEIEGVITKLKDDEKQAVTDAVLVRLIVSKAGVEDDEPTKVMRGLKNNILKNDDIKAHFLEAVESDDKLDDIMDAFVDNPITSANGLKKIIDGEDSLNSTFNKFKQSSNRLSFKGEKDGKRRKTLNELEEIRDNLDDISISDFKELTTDENLDAKDVIKQISDILYKLKKDLSI